MDKNTEQTINLQGFVGSADEFGDLIGRFMYEGFSVNALGTHSQDGKTLWRIHAYKGAKKNPNEPKFKPAETDLHQPQTG